MRPWSSVPIHDSGEPLVALPPQLRRLEPHPYAALGAPYGQGASPFRLRAPVVERLLQAQALLRQREPGWCLAIFDAWRPVAVQRFMVEHAINEECRERGVDWRLPSPELEAVITAVGRFWAPPSDDPATPPPHSTGGAVDLTLADREGTELAMGCPIDAIGAVSEPDFFLQQAQGLPAGEQRDACLIWHQRREALRSAMQAAGFAQHPNEWWHFSWGDQLWAWRTGESAARFGRSPD
jgi:D-alanyl-D-alanine dipeptidase